MKSATGVQPEIIFLSFRSAFFDVHVNVKSELGRLSCFWVQLCASRCPAKLGHSLL